MRIRESIKKSKEWLKEYREEKKRIKEDDRSTKMVELRRRWKANKKWLLETSKKYNLHYYSYLEGGLNEVPEIKEKMSELYIPTETDFEKEHYQEIRGDSHRENMLGSFALRKWHKISVEYFLGSRKGHGFGKTNQPSLIDEIFCRESRQKQNYDFNTYLFRTVHFVKGIGEWKELTKAMRAKIPYPLVYRPIFDKNGYAILERTFEYGNGRWECRPIHPSEAWHPWSRHVWNKICTYFFFLLSKIGIDKWHPGWTSGMFMGYTRRPFDRLLPRYSLINRIFFPILRIWVK